MGFIVESAVAAVQNYVLANYLKWILALVILVVGFILIKIIDRNLKHFFDRVDFDRTLELYLIKAANIFLWAILAAVILANIGVNITGFIAGLGIIGFVVGFATKDVLSNLAAGILLLINKPFKVGENVTVAGITGRVKVMALPACIIVTEDNDYVTIPNTKIWGGPIKNHSRLKK